MTRKIIHQYEVGKRMFLDIAICGAGRRLAGSWTPSHVTCKNCIRVLNKKRTPCQHRVIRKMAIRGSEKSAEELGLKGFMSCWRCVACGLMFTPLKLGGSL